MPAEVVKVLLESGVMGVLLIVAGWWIWVKDRAALTALKEWNAERAELIKQIGEEKDARVIDAQNYAQMSLALQSRVLDATHKMADIYETWEQPQPAPSQAPANRPRLPREEPNDYPEPGPQRSNRR